jgi:hypothetical protein
MSNESNASAWEMSDGIEFDAKIIDAHFGYRTEKPDKLLCILELEKEDGEIRDQFYTVGGNFEASGDGSRLIPLNPKRAKIGKQTNYGLLGTAALQTDARLILMRRDPLAAATWKGLEFTFSQKEFKSRDGEITWNVLLPIEFIADNGEGATGKDAGSKDADNEVLAALTKLANASSDAAEFAERALVEVPGVESDDEWSRKILDAAFYAELKG